jgi:hypothetical protein
MQIEEVKIPLRHFIEPKSFFDYLDPLIDEIADYKAGVRIVIQDESRLRPRIFTNCIIYRFLEHIPADEVTIVVANGMHRACSENELESMLGGGICGKLKIYQNNPMGSFPSTFFRYPCVAIHNSMPHMHVGYTTAGKMFMPGLADFQDVTHWHRSARGEAYAEMTKMDNKFSHIIDFTIHPEGERLMGFYAGKPSGDYYEWVMQQWELFKTEIAEPYDVVILEPAVKTRDFHQAMNALHALKVDERIVKKNGIVVLSGPNTHFVGMHYAFGQPNGVHKIFYDEAFDWINTKKMFVLNFPWISEFLLREHFTYPVMNFATDTRLEQFIHSRFSPEVRVLKLKGADVMYPVLKGV